MHFACTQNADESQFNINYNLSDCQSNSLSRDRLRHAPSALELISLGCWRHTQIASMMPCVQHSSRLQLLADTICSRVSASHACRSPDSMLGSHWTSRRVTWLLRTNWLRYRLCFSSSIYSMKAGQPSVTHDSSVTHNSSVIHNWSVTTQMSHTTQVHSQLKCHSQRKCHS